MRLTVPEKDQKRAPRDWIGQARLARCLQKSYPDPPRASSPAFSRLPCLHTSTFAAFDCLLVISDLCFSPPIIFHPLFVTCSSSRPFSLTSAYVGCVPAGCSTHPIGQFWYLSYPRSIRCRIPELIQTTSLWPFYLHIVALPTHTLLVLYNLWLFLIDFTCFCLVVRQCSEMLLIVTVSGTETP